MLPVPALSAGTIVLQEIMSTGQATTLSALLLVCRRLPETSGTLLMKSSDNVQSLSVYDIDPGCSSMLLPPTIGIWLLKPKELSIVDRLNSHVLH